MNQKLKLYGFNNLTKSLSFNIYDVCYARSEREQKEYIEYIDEQYNSDRLTKIIVNVAEMIGAKILNISKQDYDPQGASVTMLISEENREVIPESLESNTSEEGVTMEMLESDTVLAHLDKSHITVHTYPEFHPGSSIGTFRVDIDVSTCGTITPLKTLDYLIGCFDSDIISMDYRVRGFTRDIDGKKVFLENKINSIQEYVPDEILKKYDAMDFNIYQCNLFHTKMLIKNVDLKNYLFRSTIEDIDPETRIDMEHTLRREMVEIYNGMNIY